MKPISNFKKIIALSVLISLIPAQSKAAWYDSFFSSVKENIVAIASVAVGAAAVCGLMWWKTSSDLSKLRKSKPTDIAQAKDEGKKEAEEAAQKQLETHRAAIETAIKSQAFPQHKEIDAAVARRNESTQRLLATTEHLKVRYGRLYATSRLLSAACNESLSLDTLLNNAQLLCERVDALKNPAKPDTASYNKESEEPIANFKRLKDEITSVHERLEALHTISIASAAHATSAGYESSLGLTGLIQPHQMYEFIGLDRNLARTCTHTHIMQEIHQIKAKAQAQEKEKLQILAAIEKLFKNEITKMHFDMYLKGHASFAQWHKLIAEKQARIQDLFDRASTHKLYLESQIAHVERLMQTMAANRTYSATHPQSARGAAAATGAPSIHITTPVTRAGGAKPAAANAGAASTQNASGFTGTLTTAIRSLFPASPSEVAPAKPFHHSDN